jgi:hypothetical protein
MKTLGNLCRCIVGASLALAVLGFISANTALAQEKGAQKLTQRESGGTKQALAKAGTVSAADKAAQQQVVSMLQQMGFTVGLATKTPAGTWKVQVHRFHPAAAKGEFRGALTVKAKVGGRASGVKQSAQGNSRATNSGEQSAPTAGFKGTSAGSGARGMDLDKVSSGGSSVGGLTGGASSGGKEHGVNPDKASSGGKEQHGIGPSHGGDPSGGGGSDDGSDTGIDFDKIFGSPAGTGGGTSGGGEQGGGTIGGTSGGGDEGGGTTGGTDGGSSSRLANRGAVLEVSVAGGVLSLNSRELSRLGLAPKGSSAGNGRLIFR